MLDSTKKTQSVARALHAIAPPSEDRSFAQDVVLGLSSAPKQLPCKYFYDARGSALFDRITELPEYYPTRTEIALMRDHAAKMAATIGARALLVELGSGSSVKTRLLLDELERPAGYVPIDISAEHLQQAASSIAADYPELEVMPVAADFTRGFVIPRPRAGAARSVMYFPGSTIGNFTRERALELLRAIARFVGANEDERPGGLLLGFDLVKPADVLVRAYDDAQGVTAAFNLNLLERINRELDGDFDLAQFEHHAVWNPKLARIELYLRSTRAQVVHAAGRSFEFAAGELTLTEYSHKYTRDSILSLAHQAGFERSTIWTDPEQRFGVGLFQLAD
ncbi:L-histidine N(alpha)-methyltransferase [Enhygromyxa salina]|uniref:Histidine-specific methyltransferase EgtD n=1 Tax=Enhygromyxa salina TaxID=215803 RepID=A0A2S9YUT4_9BACT|nr:L-histidine N(alpha)-methyltransferase [Enhygromyxa salina]PRQ08802.1 Histidine-specific methyltransferase EgtD [Enhygromyxa salina]